MTVSLINSLVMGKKVVSPLIAVKGRSFKWFTKAWFR